MSSRTIYYLPPCETRDDIFAWAERLGLHHVRVERGPDRRWRGIGVLHHEEPAREPGCSCSIPPTDIKTACAISPDCTVHGDWTRRIREMIATTTTGETR